LLRRRANILVVERPRPLSVAEAAAALGASDAYVRRLLITQRLYGVKVGPVWAIYREDLELFQRMRRPPGRPSKPAEGEAEGRKRIARDRASAGVEGLLRQHGRTRQEPPA
jgi:excisionase family DNA binding protein